MEYSTEISVDLRQMVLAIESAISLVGMNDTNHGKRVGYIALQMASRLDYSEEEKQFIFDLGLLHDCGVSSDSVHAHLANQFDWERSDEHCRIGYDLLKDFSPLKLLALPILYHHTPWKDLKNLKIPESDKKLANMIFLADRVDVTAAAYYGPNVLMYTDTIRSAVSSKVDEYFDPELMDVLMAVSSPEAFWLSLEDRHINRFVWDMAGRGYEKMLDMDNLKYLARIFSYIVDQKSPFTAEHSYGVAALSRHLAEVFGLSEFETDKVEVAAYLHDVGKLHVPDSILEKPGPLTDLERSVINQHSYETYEILRPITGLEEIAKWAAYHHDNCVGTGYPFHPSQTDFSLPARIIAVSDVFQALVQDRPYRSGMPVDKVVSILKEMAEDGKLDRTVVGVAVGDARQCYEVSRGKPPVI